MLLMTFCYAYQNMQLTKLSLGLGYCSKHIKWSQWEISVSDFLLLGDHLSALHCSGQCSGCILHQRSVIKT